MLTRQDLQLQVLLLELASHLSLGNLTEIEVVLELHQQGSQLFQPDNKLVTNSYKTSLVRSTHNFQMKVWRWKKIMDKVLYMLIGPKGSGKTYIGTLVNTHTDIQFIRVEPIWLSLQPGEDGSKKVEQVIDTMFTSYDKVMIESLGAGEDFAAFRTSLEKKYTLKMIRVYADLDICFARVKSRNSAYHIPVSDDKVEQYNKIAATVTYDWDLEINNNTPASDDTILAAIKILFE